MKTAPYYTGWFLEHEHAAEDLDRYFRWYNTEHYHSSIDYVTPEQCHRGLREAIIVNAKSDSKLIVS